jgi:hypothetical protein
VLSNSPVELPAFDGHTDTVPDIVGRIGGANDLVIFTEGNHFPALLGGEVLDPFRVWAKADSRFADLILDEIAVVTLPQPVIVAAMLHGGVKFGNAIVDVSIKSGFYPDIVMGGAEPLAELHRAGLVRADARVFARNAGLALVVRKGNPLGIASPKDLLRPEVTIVLASDVEPGARAQYRRALGALIGESAAAELFTRELVTFDGRLGIQHRDVPEALAKSYANVGIIFRACIPARHEQRPITSTGEVVIGSRTAACRFRHVGPRARLTAGPAYFDDLVLDIAVIPAQKSRDLLHRKAAHEHVAKLGQLRIRPFPCGVSPPTVRRQRRCPVDRASRYQSGARARSVRDFAGC